MLSKEIFGLRKTVETLREALTIKDVDCNREKQNLERSLRDEREHLQETIANLRAHLEGSDA